MNTTALITAIKSVLPETQDKFPLHEPEFNGNEWSYVKSCIDDGWVSSVGSFVDRFEKELARTCGVEFAIATVNGTAALHGAITACGIGAGDEVFLPSMTFIATANAIAYTRAIPHFVDSEYDTLGVDAKKLEKYLLDIAKYKPDENAYINKYSGNILKAIIPMHVFGIPCDMDEINRVAQRYNLVVIEDAAESLGSSYKGKQCGSLSTIGALSFNGNKIITTGGGGAILTNDAKLAARARHLCTTAKLPHQYEYQHDEVGFNYRLPNINAALGCAQLEQLDSFLQRKKELAKNYLSALSEFDDVRFLVPPEGYISNNWLNAIVLSREIDFPQRETIIKQLHDAGLLVRPVWKLLHSLPMFMHMPKMDLSCATDLEKRIINLPSSAYLGLTV